LNAFLKAIRKLSSAKPNRQFISSFRALKRQYPSGEDPWGLDLGLFRKVFVKLWPFYQHYFRVRIFGGENVPKTGSFVAVGNHSGQIALDGALVIAAFFTDIPNPRILRPMVERFVYKTPFLGSWVASLGGVLGDRRNCQSLLNQNEAVLVFPEGVRGIAKNTAEHYQLQSFTLGFYRMALESGAPILPIAVVGAEEFYPYVFQARGVARKLGLPALPITPNLVPLPSPVDIHIGELIHLPKNISKDASDPIIREQVEKIQAQIQKMVDDGLKKRRPFITAKTTRSNATS